VTVVETIRGGTVGDERDYNLAVLVILLLLFWPLAIIYYYTRPMKPDYYPYGPPPSQPRSAGEPTYGGTQVIYCRHCNSRIASPAAFCPYCGGKLS